MSFFYLPYHMFSRFDIFGTQVSLNYNKNNQFKTPFGGAVTISCLFFVCFLCYLAVILIVQSLTPYQTYETIQNRHMIKMMNINKKFHNYLIFINQISTLFEKSEVNFKQSVNYSTEPSTIEVGSKSLMIAIKFDQTNFIERPMVNITFEQRHYSRYPNGTLLQRKIPYSLEPCTIDHFINVPANNINWTDTFHNQNISDYLCIQKDRNFQLGGLFENNEFYHIKFVLTKCVNSTTAHGAWNPVCQSPSVIASKVNEDARVKFLFSNNLINPEKATDSLTSFLDSQLFNVQQTGMYTTANIYINEQTLITDESIIPLENSKTQKLLQFKSGDYKQQTSIGTFEKFCEIFFLRSNFSTVSQKSYLKLDRVISYVGGFCQIFFLISTFIVRKYNQHIFSIELANRLYDFEINREKQSTENQRINQYDKKTNDSSKVRQNILSDLRRQSYLNNQMNTQMYDQKSKVQTISTLNTLTNDGGVSGREQNRLIPLDQIRKALMDENNLKKKSTLSQRISQHYEDPLSVMQSPQNLNFNSSLNMVQKEYNKSVRDKKHFDQLEILQEEQNENQSIKDGDIYKKQLSSQRKIGNLIKDSQYIDSNNNVYQSDKVDSIKQSNLEDQLTDRKEINNLHSQNAIQNFNQPNTRFNFQDVNQKGGIFSNTESKENKVSTFLNNKQGSKTILQKLGVDTNQFLEKELKYIIARDRSLWLNVKYFLNKLTCQKMFNSYEVKLLNKALELVKIDLDIFTILDRQKEVEKMKNLFLNEDQQVLFNFFPKPLIKVVDEEAVLNVQQIKKEEEDIHKNVIKLNKSHKRLNVSFQNVGTVAKAIVKLRKSKNSKMSNYQKLFSHFEKLSSQCSSDHPQAILNQKLIEMLGDEMKNIFEIANMMKQKEKGKRSSILETQKNPSVYSNFQIQSLRKIEEKSNFHSEKQIEISSKNEQDINQVFNDKRENNNFNKEFANPDQQNPQVTLQTETLTTEQNQGISDTDVIKFEENDLDLDELESKRDTESQQ